MRDVALDRRSDHAERFADHRCQLGRPERGARDGGPVALEAGGADDAAPIDRWLRRGGRRPRLILPIRHVGSLETEWRLRDERTREAVREARLFGIEEDFAARSRFL